jgi:hypothetical protein
MNQECGQAEFAGHAGLRWLADGSQRANLCGNGQGWGPMKIAATDDRLS